MKRVKILIASLILAASFTSCSDFLSEIPDNRTQLDSSVKIGELLVTAYPQYGYPSFTELMSDNVWDCGDETMTIDYHLSEFKWELEERISQDSPSAYWDGCYKAIAAANEALDAIDKLGNDDGKLNALRGEALMARAYAHHMLVQLWSKAYNPATAASDVGIPYVNKPERKLIQEYSRGTVQEVYANIEKDLLEGLPLLTDNYKQPKFHFNRTAGHAFASRFYLTMGNFEKVLEHSEYLAANPSAFIRDYAEFNAINLNAKFQQYSRPSVRTNLLLTTAVSSYNRYNRYSRFWLTGADEGIIMGATIPSQGINNSKNPWNKWWLYDSGSFNGQKTMVYPKLGEYFRLDDPSAGTGLPFVNFVLLSNDEVYLNRLEALVMTNRVQEAVDGLNFFLAARTEGYVASSDKKVDIAKLKALYPAEEGYLTPAFEMTNEQAIVMNAILEAKRREFIQEGQRWFDVKRFNIVVTHEFVSGEKLVLGKDDARRQLPLPLHVTAAGIPDNPRN